MLMAIRFFKCTVCGNVVVKAVDSGMKLSCCGREMVELVPGESEGSGEKHLPVFEWKDDDVLKVKIGSVAHPMDKTHWIMFICLETERGFQVVNLGPDMKAEAVFHICKKDRPVAVYAYCNIHGLWRTEVQSDRKNCRFLIGCH